MGGVKILVPIKRVIDAALKPRINKTLTGVETSGVKFSINPFDDIAIEESVKIKKNHKSQIESIHAVSIGPSKAKEILRIALAKGVDKSTLIETDAEVEPLAVSKILKQVIEKDGNNLVLLGKQAIDDDSNQVGQMLAGLLNWSQATNAAKVTLIEGEDSVEVEREIDGGIETVRCKLPCVISTDLRLNEPKFVSLPKMMKAKKKPIDVLKVEELGVDISPRLETLELKEPEARKPGVIVKDVDELISKLKELKAI